MEGVLEEIDRIIETREPSLIVAINPEKIMKAQNDESLRELLNSAAVQIPDGVGVLLASKLKGGKIKSRVTGIDLMQAICKRAAERNYRVFLLGAKPGIAQRASEILVERYPGLNIAGIRDGYFSDSMEVVEFVKQRKPDIIFAAMGSPKQEYWIMENMDRMQVPVCMGVGGSYDVICGNIKRAPAWMCRLGIEWLHRLIKEPSRYKRMMVLPVFLLRVFFKGVKK
jgi:N-acetylglucosaminyldiphosphoundecaprenol N-acetyl-beta-D-mannosaminyltransferase